MAFDTEELLEALKDNDVTQLKVVNHWRGETQRSIVPITRNGNHVSIGISESTFRILVARGIVTNKTFTFGGFIYDLRLP